MTFRQLFAKVRRSLSRRKTPCALTFFDIATPEIIAAVDRVNRPEWQECTVDAPYAVTHFFRFIAFIFAAAALRVAHSSDDAVYRHASDIVETFRLALVAELGVPIPPYLIQSPLAATVAAGLIQVCRDRNGKRCVRATRRMVAVTRRAGRSSDNSGVDAAIQN